MIRTVEVEPLSFVRGMFSCCFCFYLAVWSGFLASWLVLALFFESWSE